MYIKEILFFGLPYTVVCDGKCEKAWGINQRPFIQLSDNEDDIAWLSDKELGLAPQNPGTYEGGEGKPFNAESGLDMNRWCVRECERCSKFKENEEIKLKSLNERIYNIPKNKEV